MQERRVACRAQVALLIQILEITIPMNAIVFHSPVGDIYLYEENHCLAAVSHTLLKTDACWQETPLLREAARQLDEYFRGSRRQFTLPLQMHRTPFQCAVWQMLQQIPYGETRSYREVAVGIGNPKAVRAVGMANHRNPFLIIVPCHRVIGSGGSLTGYAAGLDMKRFLLQLEREHTETFFRLSD